MNPQESEWIYGWEDAPWDSEIVGGWVDESMRKWMDLWMRGWIHEKANGSMDERMHHETGKESMDEWMNPWQMSLRKLNGAMDVWMEAKWINGSMDPLIHRSIHFLIDSSTHYSSIHFPIHKFIDHSSIDPFTIKSSTHRKNYSLMDSSTLIMIYEWVDESMKKRMDLWMRGCTMRLWKGLWMSGWIHEKVNGPMDVWINP